MCEDNTKQNEGLISKLIKGIIAFFIASLIGMWLWNACLVAIFPSLPELTYLQMCGVKILCNFLFSRSK